MFGLSHLRQTWYLTRRYGALTSHPWKALSFFLLGSRRPDRTLDFSWDGQPLVFRWRDWGCVEEIVGSDEYGFTRELLTGTASPLVVDLGANIGLFSLHIFRHAPQAEVHAAEASAETFRVLERNRALQPQRRWRTYHVAVWKEDGTVPFLDLPASTSSRISFTPAAATTVPAQSLPSLLERMVGPRTVDLLKMDIEGAELAVLPTSASSLTRVRHLLVELHTNIGPIHDAVTALRQAFPHLYRIPGRRSQKPLVLATRDPQALPTFSTDDA
ncbi:MAG: FkbM family methyltransferase [bacterium]|nr:FkbM family methyltransferase [bacterium]